MKLLFIFGNAAVGKMTVGQELAKITHLRLFHNHMAIEPVLEIFGSYNPETIRKLREVIFEEFAKSDNYGMIFTYMLAFDLPSDMEYIEHIKDIFRANNDSAEFYYVELTSPQNVRLKRNESENRLANKASKNDLEASRSRLINDDENYRMESLEGEIEFDNYLKIDNSELSPEAVAAIIKERFDFR